MGKGKKGGKKGGKGSKKAEKAPAHGHGWYQVRFISIRLMGHNIWHHMYIQKYYCLTENKPIERNALIKLKQLFKN